MVPYYVMQVKHGQRLQAALTMVEFLGGHLVPKMKARDAHELRIVHEARNMTLNAEMVLRASLFRRESRGSHYREDFPERVDPDWLAWTVLQQEQGEMKVLKLPIPKEWWPDLSKPYQERYELRFPSEVPRAG
jgi:succinate dehydrogenase/fumarate reductase flavoprotein subunit